MRGFRKRTARAGGLTIAASISFDPASQTVTITPLAPLPDNASVSLAVDGITDPVGNAVIPMTAHLTTLGGPMFLR